MSTVLARAPLEPIGMNAAGDSPVGKRRSARLSGGSAQDENEPPSKKAKVNGSAAAQSVSTKTQDGAPVAMESKRKKKAVYDQESDGFMFTKSKRKATKEPAVRPATRDGPPVEQVGGEATVAAQTPVRKPVQDVVHTTTVKTRRRLPTTPESGKAEQSVRKTRQQPDTVKPSPHRPAHAQSHANTDRHQSPFRPLTVEKKRRKDAGEGEERDKTARITLPASDTPIIRRNKQLRKSMADGSHRRSSAGLRGRRASSLIDVGKGKALPHAEVPAPEFYKHISADLIENRRMRLLLGWCASRALPSKPDPPKESTKEANEEFQALQAARVVQEELAQELTSNGVLSDWFSRDDEVQAAPIVLRKKPNPRNVANLAKAEELERELERLKKERDEWDSLIQSTERISQSTAAAPPTSNRSDPSQSDDGNLSPMHPELLSSPQRNVLEQLQRPSDESTTEPDDIRQRLQTISSGLEFSIDTFAHSVHALSTTKQIAERVAERSLSDAAGTLDKREKARAAASGERKVDALDALRGLAKVLNARR